MLHRNPAPREERIDETKNVNCALICKNPTSYSSKEVSIPLTG
jgi:hypothetical protein